MSECDIFITWNSSSPYLKLTQNALSQTSMPSTHYKNTDNLKCNDHFSKFPFATLMKLTEHSLWNAPMEHRKFRAFPKLIFKTLKCNDHFSKFPFATLIRLLPRIHMNSTRFPERVTDSLTVTRDRYFWHLHDPCDLKCAPPHSCKWNIDVLSGSPNNPSIHTCPPCGVKTTFSRSTDLRMWYFHHLELSLK